jgi:diaminopimelate epimerase
MCGNGGRCIAAFAQKLGMIQEKTRFKAIDGTHLAEVRKDGSVRLRMMDVSRIETGDGFFFLDTGSPHYVKFLPSVDNLDVFAEGRKIRNSDRFTDAGTNVNFVADLGERIYVRTYERGVENETLACGTGVVASVICAAILKGINHTGFSLAARVRGGELLVSLYRKDHEFTEIWLDGPATFVFEGLIHIPA